MRLAYPDGKHKNQLQGYLSTIYGYCQMIGYKIFYKEYTTNKIGLEVGLGIFGLDMGKYRFLLIYHYNALCTGL